MMLNCIIIDDEPLAANLLAGYVKKTPFLNLMGTYNSAIAAIKEIKENTVHLVFLDIQMPDLSGLEFAKILPQDTKIVFTTAFSQYAVDGYKSNAVDYLLKPISYEDFLKCANKILLWFDSHLKQEQFIKDRFIFVKSDYKLIQVLFDDILYIEGVKDYVRIYTKSVEPSGETVVKGIMSLMNMKKWQDSLPYPEFMRTHRSYIVHMTKIKLVDRLRIVVGDTYIPISDTYKKEVDAFLDAHTM